MKFPKFFFIFLTLIGLGTAIIVVPLTAIVFYVLYSVQSVPLLNAITLSVVIMFSTSILSALFTIGGLIGMRSVQEKEDRWII